jgi:uncharacterized membrane protein
VTKAVTTIVTVILVVMSLAAVAPRITEILGALPPVILISAISAAVLRAIWFYTR